MIIEIPLALSGLLLAILSAAVYFSLLNPVRLNVISVMLLTHIVIQLLPAFAFLLTPGYPEALEFFLAACLAAALIPIGGLLADLARPDARLRLRRFYQRAHSLGRMQGRLRFFAYTMLVVLASLSAAYALAAPGWPLLELLSGTSESHQDFMQSRRQASVGRFGYLFAVAKLYFMPFAVGVILSWWLAKERSSLIISLMLAIILLLAVFYNSYSGATTGVAILAAVAVLVMWHHYVQRFRSGLYSRGRLWRFGLVGIVIVLTYPVFLGFVKPIGELGLWYILTQEVAARIVTKPALNAYYAFEVFPTQLPYTWFADIWDVAVLTGREFINTGTVISLYKGQGALNQAPPPTLGTLYAQGGWPIVSAGYIFAAMIFRFLENVVTSVRHKTPVEVSLHALLIFGAFRLAWSKLHYVLWTETIVPTVIVLLAWKLCRARLVPVSLQRSDSRE